MKSIDLYLLYRSHDIVETDILEDVGCAMYPCYYTRKSGKILVSTSALKLIKFLGGLQKDPKFKPPDFYNNPPRVFRKRRFNDLFNNIENKGWLNRKILHTLHFVLKGLGILFSFDIIEFAFGERIVIEPGWYYSLNTIDKRVKKLGAFEKITLSEQSVELDRQLVYNGKKQILEKAAHYFTSYINNVEREFPEYQHVILTAGKDSQLIWLAPKLDHKKWHCFTAEPNVSIVKAWLKKNGIEYTTFFDHNNHNEEDINDLKLKTLSGDLYSDVTHIRWMPKMKEIADHYNNKVIFWGGTIADAIFKYYPAYHKDADTFFEMHSKRASSFQGNYHQVFKNFTGCPYLSPYHSEDIWKELFTKMDPLFIEPYGDVRKELGQLLAGKDIHWIDDNPGPQPYTYDFSFQPIDYYINNLTD